MAYTKTNWRTDDVITAPLLNKMEHGIYDASEASAQIQENTDDIDQLKSDLTAKSSNAQLQNGTYNIVTPPMHVGTWKESTQEFITSTNRVVFDAIQPYTGTERIYAFDSTVQVFVVYFDSNNVQLNYVGWANETSPEFKTAGGYFDIADLAKAIGVTNASKYLCVLRFKDNRTITKASEITSKVVIVNDYEGEGFELPLVMLGPHLGAPFIKIYPNSGQVQINGNMYVYTKAGYYCIPISDTYSVTLTHGQTLVLDLSDIPINYEDTTIDKSNALKVVNYSSYSKWCIPIANCRDLDGEKRLYVSGTFTQFIVPEFGKATLKLETFKEAYYPYTMHNAGSGWLSRINLLHISDTHIGTDNAYNNFLESIEVGNSLYAENVISAVVNTGDNTNGGGSSLSNFLAEYTKNTSALATSTAPYLMQLGNHDANNGNTVAIADVPTKNNLFPPFQNIFAQTGVAVGDATNQERYYYYDVAQGGHSIRIIMLDMLDHPDYTASNTNYYCQWNVVYSQDQIDWLANTALDVPADYGVIICNHFPFAPHRDAGYSEIYPALNDGYFVQSATGNMADGWKMIPEIVQAWQNRATLSKTYTDTKGSQNIIANYDFSNVPVSAFFVCYLCGHTHSKNVFKVEEENGVSFNQLMMCEDSSGQNGTALNRCYKRFGTISDNAFSCLSIDMEEKKIYRTSYGVYAKCNDVDAKQTQVFDIL